MKYGAFTERRRIAAETEASARYVDDLAATVTLLEGGDAKRRPKARKPRGKKGAS